MITDFMEFKKTIRLSRYCTHCGAKIPDIHYQMLKFVKKSQKKEGNDDK